MSKGVADYYSHGEFNAICDVCGSKFKASYLRKRWDGLMVCQDDFEQRHPQDFVRGVADIQMTPWSRVEQADQFIAFCTINGCSAYVDYAVADCSVCDNTPAGFDATYEPPDCNALYYLVDTTVPGWETDWACTALVVDAKLTLDGTIGIYENV